MHTGRDRLVPCAVLCGRRGRNQRRISLPVPGRASRDCCHAAVAVAVSLSPPSRSSAERVGSNAKSTRISDRAAEPGGSSLR
jgi:hypothetical protein